MEVNMHWRITVEAVDPTGEEYRKEFLVEKNLDELGSIRSRERIGAISRKRSKDGSARIVQSYRIIGSAAISTILSVRSCRPSIS